MDSEQPVDNTEVMEVPQESEKEPDTDKGESAVESSTDPTAAGPEEPELVVLAETTGDTKEGYWFKTFEFGSTRRGGASR